VPGVCHDLPVRRRREIGLGDDAGPRQPLARINFQAGQLGPPQQDPAHPVNHLPVLQRAPGGDVAEHRPIGDAGALQPPFHRLHRDRPEPGEGRMGPVTADRERGMKRRVIVELTGGDGTVREHEVSAGGSTTIEHSPETIGLRSYNQTIS
jgi:hypothetical protein